MINDSVEYLIKNEDTIDWKRLSNDASDSFSIVEARLFRDKINWHDYIKTHRSQLATLFLEVASPYFTKHEYRNLALFGSATEEFILNHAEDFKDYIEILIKTTKISEDGWLQLQKYWEGIEGIYYTFISSKINDINDPEYSDLKLALEILNF